MPAKYLSAWIQANLYLNLAEAPFDREDATLNPVAGACLTCPRRSGFNTSLFADVKGDQCLDAPCFQTKVTAHIDRQLAARPELVSIETAWRSPKEQRPGTLQRNQYRELDIADNPDAEPPCSQTRTAIIAFGKHAGHTQMVCVEPNCPVHNPREAARIAADPPPVMESAPEQETKEEAAQREAEHQRRMAEYQAEQKRREEERKAGFDRQQKEYEAEQAKRDRQHKARVATFERIIEQAPATFNAAQTRVFLRLLIHMEPYQFLEVTAAHFAGEDENTQQSDYEIVLAALDNNADEKLTGLALRIVLSDHIGIPPRESARPADPSRTGIRAQEAKGSQKGERSGQGEEARSESRREEAARQKRAA